MVELEELKQAVRAADPAALLVPSRVLRRILQEEYKVPSLLVHAPHERCYAFDREVLFRYVEQDELDIEPDFLLPPTVVLLARPTAETLADQDREAVLLRYWRLLFHVHVHLALDERCRDGLLTRENVGARIEQIGQTEFEEIRTVLEQEKDLLRPADDLAVYLEFAAVYLELRYFRTNLRATYFPAIRDLQAIDALLEQDVDADAIFLKTRLPGAPDPVIRTDTSSDESHDYYWRLLRHADRALAEGDIVRAAVLHTKAARVAPAALTLPTRAMATRDMERLAANLQDALKFSPEEVTQWQRVLPALVDKADQGNWPVEAKLLYDLQEVCMEHQRMSFALDLVEWAVSAGRRPIKRPLKSLQLVRTTQHIRTATMRLTMARVSDDERQQLGRLLQSAQQLNEDRMRERFRPIMMDAFHDVGLAAANPPEQVALEKIIEELLDRITEYGFFTFADLRDTISRNQLKLPDLEDPHSYWRGDPLLRLDRRLAALMEGVYRRGEFYLRWLERGSSLHFGTDIGRFLTRHFLLPFGGALALLVALEILYREYFHPAAALAGATEVAARLETSREAANKNGPGPDGEAAKKDAGDNGAGKVAKGEPRQPADESPRALAGASQPEVGALHWYLYGFIPLGLFLWALMHVPRFREFFLSAGKLTYRIFRLVLYELPLLVWQMPWVRRVFTSWPFLLVYWYALKPLAVSAAIWLLFEPTRRELWRQVATFFAVDLLLNSRFGYAASEAVMEMFAVVYGWVRFEFITGVIRWIDSFFRQVLKAVESVLYTVDEWLRFRSDESRLTMLVRAVAGVVWFPIGYLIRLYFVLLMEPTLNPIKLPLSSVAFKFMCLIPFYQDFFTLDSHSRAVVMSTLAPHTGGPLAYLLTWGFIIPSLWLVPGLVAFFLWEVTANWRLFRANRSPRLKPVVIGKHGEKMLQLLRPGFHSGTVQKLFAGLRHAELSAYRDNNWRAARTFRQALREVARTVQLFIEREFIALLRQSKSWPNPPIWVAQIVLSCNRVRVELGHRAHDNQSLWLAFEEHSGWLFASIAEPGWLKLLSAEERQVLISALAGIYKLAGVDLVREQIAAALAPESPRYEVVDRRLLIRDGQTAGKVIAYDLGGDPDLLPRHHDDGEVCGKRLDPKTIFFSRVPIEWSDWVACWEQDHAGKGHPLLLPRSLALLPDETPPKILPFGEATDVAV